jgi:hypothetical protein
VSDFVAGAVGIEPTQKVLETFVLPLYDAPTAYDYSYIIANPARGGVILLGFFVSSLHAAVLTILFDLKSRLGVLSVLRGGVVQVVTHSTFKIDTVIL